MRHSLTRTALSVVCFLFCLSTMTENAFASFQMRYRAKWRTDYVDGNIGQYLTGTTDTDRPARYIWYDIYTGTGSTHVAWGVLNSSGDTAYFTANNGQNYWLVLTTVLEKGGNLFVLEATTMNTNCVSGTPAAKYYHHVVPSGIPNNTFKTYSGTYDVGYHAGVAPVGAQVLDMSALFDMPPIRVISVVGFDGMGSQYQGDNRLCLDWVGPGHHFWKWLLAHEFGHALSDHQYGVIWRGEQGIAEVDTDTSHFCGANTAHNLISWERIDDTQSEGFANFAASVLMFTRTAASPVFGVRTALTLPSFIPAPVRTAALSPPWSASMTTQYKYMENACYWNMVDHGIEWDWQNFFWQVWSTGVNKIEIADMFDIWPTGYPDTTWQNRRWVVIDAWAEFFLTPNQLMNFRDKADLNGINH